VEPPADQHDVKAIFLVGKAPPVVLLAFEAGKEHVAGRNDGYNGAAVTTEVQVIATGVKEDPMSVV